MIEVRQPSAKGSRVSMMIQEGLMAGHPRSVLSLDHVVLILKLRDAGCRRF
jgi:hypothetical protein